VVVLLAFGSPVQAGSDDLVHDWTSVVSPMGPNGDPEFDARDPAVAFDPSSGEFLVVWTGKEVNTGGLVNGEFEISAQRVDSDGSLVGSRVRVSAMGPDGDPTFAASKPAVAFDPSSSEFLVVWTGLVDNEFEIWSACRPGWFACWLTDPCIGNGTRRRPYICRDYTGGGVRSVVW